MSDLATVNALTSTSPQLPIPWYFDPRVYALEQELLFAQGPGYVGHELMAPNRGDYQVLAALDNAKALVRSEQGVQLIGNVCRHRQAIILKDRGNAKSLVCPLHRWTYGLDGRLLGAPHFPGNPCLDLGSTPVQNWHGLLFAGQRDVARDLARLGVDRELDFSGFMLDRVQIEEYACNWKTFIEVYLEDYHVVPFHPGLGNFVEIDDLKWEFGDWYSVQTCGVKPDLVRGGTPVYQQWHDLLLRFNEGRKPAHGAIWLTYYPNIMIEWYPHVLVISQVVPRGPEACAHVIEFYYPEEIALFEREFVAAEQAAYEETAIEDDEICRRMTDGRRALYRQGVNQVGPYQSPMEDGMLHFHEFLRRELGQLPI
jgi:phenylpropionate dioxygenase-like ring-hydroxylating dioxygenase large terminal subunit